MPADRPLPDALEALSSRLSDALATILPDGIDWRGRMAPVIETTLERLELVPREDFERAVAQLERLQRDIVVLEARIATLERDRPH